MRNRENDRLIPTVQQVGRRVRNRGSSTMTRRHKDTSPQEGVAERADEDGT